MTTLEDALYEEAQSRLRLSMTCSHMVRPLRYLLWSRIVDLAHLLSPLAQVSPLRSCRFDAWSVWSGLVDYPPGNVHQTDRTAYAPLLCASLSYQAEQSLLLDPQPLREGSPSVEYP